MKDAIVGMIFGALLMFCGFLIYNDFQLDKKCEAKGGQLVHSVCFSKSVLIELK